MIHRGQIWSHSWVKRSDTNDRASGIGEWVLESNVVLEGIRIRVHNPGCEHYPHYPHFEGNFDQLSTLSFDWELFWKIRVLYGYTREEKISRIKCDCVVSLCKKYMMVHTYPRHVSLALYVVFFCARIVSGMCMIIGRGVYQLNVSLCDDVKRGVPFPYLKSILVYLISNSSLNFSVGTHQRTHQSRYG